MLPVHHTAGHAPPVRPAAPVRPLAPFTPRPARPGAGAEPAPATSVPADAVAPWRAPPRRQQGGDSGGMAASAAGDGAPADLDQCAATLAGLGADDGVFAVALADGRTLDVALQRHGAALHFLLGCADAALARQLRRRRMELQQGLQRRMSASVTLTVL